MTILSPFDPPTAGAVRAVAALGLLPTAHPADVVLSPNPTQLPGGCALQSAHQRVGRVGADRRARGPAHRCGGVGPRVSLAELPAVVLRAPGGSRLGAGRAAHRGRAGPRQLLLPHRTDRPLTAGRAGPLPAVVGVPIVPTGCPTLLSPLCHAARVGRRDSAGRRDRLGALQPRRRRSRAVRRGSSARSVRSSARRRRSHCRPGGSRRTSRSWARLPPSSCCRCSWSGSSRPSTASRPPHWSASRSSSSRWPCCSAAVAVQLVQLALSVTDACRPPLRRGAAASVTAALDGLGKALVASSATGVSGPPSLVVLLGALLVAFGALALWIELPRPRRCGLRGRAVPPAGPRHRRGPLALPLVRRLVETLAALVLSKFVITAVLSLAAGALASGTATGFAGVLAGGALLLLATFMPFALLRLVPAAEAGAIAHLESVRHRAQQSAVTSGRTAAAIALRAAGAASFPQEEPGTGLDLLPEPPGPDAGMAGADPPGATRSEGRHEGEGSGASDPGPARAPRSGGSGSPNPPSPEGVPFWQGTPPPAGEPSQPAGARSAAAPRATRRRRRPRVASRRAVLASLRRPP